MTNENYNNKRLTELSGSDYEIADGEPDIKGWKVKLSQEQKIGSVDDLLFDVQSLKVRYLIVDLKDNMPDLSSKKVLVPIGVAELYKDDKDVFLPNVTTEQIAQLPDYKTGVLTMETESAIRNVLEGGRKSYDNDFYNHEHFNEENFYNRRDERLQNNTVIPVIEENINVGKRTVETGGVRIIKKMIEQPVEEHVQLREEHVTIERNTVNKPLTNGTLPFEETTIELTEHAEVPVVKKEARIVEEISIGKDVEQHEETIKDTVRSTEVNIEEISSGNNNSL